MAFFYILALTLAVCSQYTHAGTPGRITFKNPHIEATGWGLDDSEMSDGYAGIKINDTAYFDWNGEPAIKGAYVAGKLIRGIHMLSLLEVEGGYMAYRYVIYDTLSRENHARACATFIDVHPEGTIIVGVSADSMASKWADCNNALATLGVDVSKIALRTSLAFVAKKGDPDFIKQESSPRYEGPSSVEVDISSEGEMVEPTPEPTTPEPTTPEPTTPEPTTPEPTTPEPTEPEPTELGICSLPRAAGDKKCNGKKVKKSDRMPAFYFSNGKCKKFKYTGCGGNENNFPNKKACMSACM